MILQHSGGVKATGFASRAFLALAALVCFLPHGLALPVPKHLEPPAGFQVLVDAPVEDVLKVVQQVIEDQVVHGTYSYEKERTLTGAHAATSSSLLDPAEPPAMTLYKVADNIIAPRHFKNTGDIGTITVRYVVRAVSPGKTNLQIAAVFYDARHVVHWSQGAVEAEEYGAIQQHLRELESMRLAAKEAADRNDDARQSGSEIRSEVPSAGEAGRTGPAPPVQSAAVVAGTPEPASGNSAGSRDAEQQLEQEVGTLRRQVERRVKAKDTPLKSAPFQGATTLQKLPAQAEVVILIITPYWYGVEAENGQRGWIHHSRLEPLP
jgi:hypothetical protein